MHTDRHEDLSHPPAFIGRSSLVGADWIAAPGSTRILRPCRGRAGLEHAASSVASALTIRFTAAKRDAIPFRRWRRGTVEPGPGHRRRCRRVLESRSRKEQRAALSQRLCASTLQHKSSAIGPIPDRRLQRVIPAWLEKRLEFRRRSELLVFAQSGRAIGGARQLVFRSWPDQAPVDRPVRNRHSLMGSSSAGSDSTSPKENSRIFLYSRRRVMPRRRAASDLFSPL